MSRHTPLRPPRCPLVLVTLATLLAVGWLSFHVAALRTQLALQAEANAQLLCTALVDAQREADLTVLFMDQRRLTAVQLAELEGRLDAVSLAATRFAATAAGAAPSLPGVGQAYAQEVRTLRAKVQRGGILTTDERRRLSDIALGLHSLGEQLALRCLL